MEFVKFLGKGSYGSVDLYRYRQNDGSMLYTAVKSSRHHSLVEEFEILLELRGCPRIVQLLAKDVLEIDGSDGNIVNMMPMEYASEGSLSDFMKTQPRLSDNTIREFTHMILQGLVSIHRHGYVHCDLKPDNLLVFSRYEQETGDYSYELKISDLGSARNAGGKPSCWRVDSPFVGTPYYMSPDSVQDGSVQKALDLWSLGCIVLQMYTGQRPWSGIRTHNGLQRILTEEYKAVPKVPEYLPCDARQFYTSVLP